MKYEIDENTILKIWTKEEIEEPTVLQPHWPNGDSWSAEDAEEWALLFIESIENPDSEFIPGLSPEAPKQKRIKPVVVTDVTIVQEELLALNSPNEGTSEITAETAE